MEGGAPAQWDASGTFVSFVDDIGGRIAANPDKIVLGLVRESLFSPRLNTDTISTIFLAVSRARPIHKLSVQVHELPTRPDCHELQQTLLKMAVDGHKTNGATPFHPRMLINGEVGLENLRAMIHEVGG